ncbi:uncharacterized protein LY89DRAFT_721729 [Mollisia scopiformis]|uniref:BZIP domain-containing protein n=1 Tax=Mollisia scopiformis TaxID=149040 RepID=A0A194WY41_MOLSC|nr:uncharacterized protein LY89DRAFT_721729 [Mollisia scopiformis]KUJ12893.1 hypothetical protein LY89DRAFT_721729 [Mollisia scopiformis]
MTQAIPVDEALDFEWHVFEQQFLDWQHMTPEAVSPETYTSTLPTRASPAIENGSCSPQSPASPENGGVGEADLEISNDSLNKQSRASSRRRIQNRASQRAFRARQRQHVEALEEKLKSVLSEYEQLQQRYTALNIAYETLLKEKRMDSMSTVTCPTYRSSWTSDDLGVFENVESGSGDGLGRILFSGLETTDRC